MAKKAAKRRDAGRPRGEPVVAAVLAETLRALEREGLAGLKIEAVAAAAGVNKTSVYRRWPTRNALAAAAITEAQAHLSAPPETGSLEGDLRAVLRAVGEFLSSTAGRATLRVALGGGADELGEGVRGALEGRAKAGARAVFAAAVARGEGVRVRDAEAVVFGLVGAALHRALLERRAIDGRWVAGAVRRALYGVVTSRGALDKGAGGARSVGS